MAGAAGKVRTNVYIDREAKEKAKGIFVKYGLSMSDAINLLLHMVAESGEMPFKLEIPNSVTRRVMREVMMGENIEDISLEELIVEAEAQKAYAVRQGFQENKDVRCSILEVCGVFKPFG